MAHPEDPGNVGHRQPVLVCRPDRLVAVGPQTFDVLLQFPFTAGVVLGERRKAGAGLRRLALGAGDQNIVRPISANRLA